MILERKGETLNTHNYLTITCDKSLKEEKQGAMIAYYRKDDLVFPETESP